MVVPEKKICLKQTSIPSSKELFVRPIKSILYNIWLAAACFQFNHQSLIKVFCQTCTCTYEQWKLEATKIFNISINNFCCSRLINSVWNSLQCLLLFSEFGGITTVSVVLSCNQNFLCTLIWTSNRNKIWKIQNLMIRGISA